MIHSDENALRRQSTTVNALRFPLIFIVLFIHVLPPYVKELGSSMNDTNLYIFISEFISHYFGNTVVPLFFVFSGYYLFFKTKDWNWDIYKQHLRKRVKGLLFPYLFWNLFSLVASYIHQWVFPRSLDPVDGVLSLKLHHIWDALAIPADFPLWYIRDLMLMHLVAPLFALAFRYFRWGTIVLLFLNYLACTIWYPSHPMAVLSTASFFFPLGAYLGLKDVYFPSIVSCRMGLWVLFLLVLLLTMLGYFDLFSRLYIPIGIFTVLTSAEHIFSHMPRVKQLCLNWESRVFFIYAIHLIYIENWIKGFFSRTPLVYSGWGQLVAYFTIPLLTLVICLGLYEGLRRISPRFLAVITGGRA